MSNKEVSASIKPPHNTHTDLLSTPTHTHDLFQPPPETVIDKLTGIQNGQLETFFVNINKNNPLVDNETAAIVSDREVVEASGKFTEHVINSAEMTLYVNILRRKFRYIDEDEAYHIAQMAIWRAFLSYPWKEGFEEQHFFNYVYTGMRNMASAVRPHQEVELDRAISSTQFTPEQQVMQQERAIDLTEQIASLSSERENQSSNKVTILMMLADGADIAEIAEALHITKQTVQQTIRKCQAVEPNALDVPINTSERVSVNAGGQWKWDAHTAQVILNSYAVRYLNESEIELLTRIASGETHTEARKSVQARTNNIQAKIRSHGVETGSTEKTYFARRKELLTWLESVNPHNDDETQIIDALRKAQGNTDEATRILGAPSRGKVANFLKKKGFYRS